MATPNSMITRAMRLARVIGRAETLDEDELADGLIALNAMLDSWQTERLFVYQIQEDSFSWTASQASRTVGSAGDFVMSLPVRIDDSSYFRTSASIDCPVTFLTQSQWAAVPSKTTTSSIPNVVYVEYGTSTHTIYAYPIPSSTITFKLRSWQLLQTFSDGTTALALPIGYQRAIEYSLAEEFGPEFQKDIPPSVQKIAYSARRNIKRVNAPLMILAPETGLMSSARSGAGYNIYTG